MRELGVDCGSVSLKLAEFENQQLIRTSYELHHGHPLDLLWRRLGERPGIDRLAVTGSFPAALAENLGAFRVNEVMATVRGVLAEMPEARSVIEIGGEDSKYIALQNGIKEFASNPLCAAGTGIFLDQQAKRLNYAVEELGTVALRSRNPARIAGRCSVFAKSDMIHLQQIGTPVEDLIAGLCYALARNYKSVVFRGRQMIPPVVFVGGVAGNLGVARALEEVLRLETGGLIIPRHHAVLGAIGAVLAARDAPAELRYRGSGPIEDWLKRPRLINRLPPLNGHHQWRTTTTARPPVAGTPAYLGIDVGSISTNLVLIDEKGTVLARRYLWTRGRPIDVVFEGLRDLADELGDKVTIVGAGTTGSGRYLIGELVGADIIRNEISAQARAAVEFNPDVDTIFEIGGQDSKYISLENRAIVDFEMNKVCAAGTGSFLEEQARILGVRLEEFGDRALSARAPIDLGERCTVFIGSEVVRHQENETERDNLLAGLGYSIVTNYLNRVVAHKRIGNTILFQGGVAANKAVVSAFAEILKKDIIVPPNHDVTGAIGIALLTRDEHLSTSRFKGFARASLKYTSESFQCGHCSNNCEITRIRVGDERPIYYGGRCERYEERTVRSANVLPDYFTLRNKDFFAETEAAGPDIGLPRALATYELYPFFSAFLKELGFNPVLSGLTDRRTIELGTEISAADTCFPVKTALGHIQSLVQKGVRELFMPSVITMPPNGDAFTRAFVCPYVQSLPYLARSLFGSDIVVHDPPLYFDRGERGVLESLFEFGRSVKKNRREVERAYRAAIAKQEQMQTRIVEQGRRALADMRGTVFVICSRPYNGFDLGMNLDLPRKIRDMGIPCVPMDFLNLNYEPLREDFYNMYWHYGQRLLAAADAVRQDERLYPVYLSNFSCGPDSFLIRFFKERVGAKPVLVLELDEHSGDAGFITRIEAFRDSIKSKPVARPPRAIRARSEVEQDRKIFIPDMGDGSRVLASAMRGAGFQAEVLPAPDEESIRLGRQFTTGRECLPAIITAGDLVKKIRSRDFDPSRSGFFMPQGSGPCRFGQYYKLQRLILDECNLPHVPIYAPNQGPSLFDDLGAMGLPFLFRVWDGICAVDALEARVRQVRPYERRKGEADQVYHEALELIGRALERRKPVVSLVRAAGHRLDLIPREQEHKPRIGIVGEIYVRSQPFSNNFLARRLEDLDCEVGMPSIAEWFFYTNFTRDRNCRWFGQNRRALFTRAFDLYMRWRQGHIYECLGLEREPKISDLIADASRYLHVSLEGEAIVSIGKTIGFMKEGYDGVINVMPFTCMPGNIVSTIFKDLHARHPSFPLLTVSYDGLDNAIDNMRLETFVSQARDHR